ncbi:MAG: hypothetical protein ABIZ49_02265 [Opitutaceae bacterium]
MVATTASEILPPLDDLVRLIPPEIRETLDDLFRVKFVRVQRLPRDLAKNNFATLL